jgi:hypothetical protein
MPFRLTGDSQQVADGVDQRTKFIAEALAARAEMLESGAGYDADDVHAYLRQRIGEKRTIRRDTKQWRK